MIGGAVADGGRRRDGRSPRPTPSATARSRTRATRFSYDIYSQAGAVARGMAGHRARRPRDRARARDRRVAVGVPAHHVRQRRRPGHAGLRRVPRARARRRRRRHSTPTRGRRDPTAPHRALPRRPPRAGALLRGRDRPHRPRLPPGAPARQRPVPSLGGRRHRARRRVHVRRRASSTPARCRSPSSPTAWHPTELADWASSSTTRSTPARSTTCSRLRCAASTGGYATAHRPRRRRASKCDADGEPSFVRRRARQRARRYPHPARRRAGRGALRRGQQRRADLASVRHDDPVHRGAARRRSTRRKRRLLARGSTPRPTVAVAAGFLLADDAEIEPSPPSYPAERERVNPGVTPTAAASWCQRPWKVGLAGAVVEEAADTGGGVVGARTPRRSRRLRGRAPSASEPSSPPSIDTLGDPHRDHRARRRATSPTRARRRPPSPAGTTRSTRPSASASSAPSRDGRSRSAPWPAPAR